MKTILQVDLNQFPIRPACFGQAGATNSTCNDVNPNMLAFLNITDPYRYKQAYCLNPPMDSCAFGYCPNPDIASPAVRAATYVGTICLSILVLYSPDNLISAFYAQLLSVYSLVLTALIASLENQLTRLHAVFALCAAGSPLSLYMEFYALRSVLGSPNRLQSVFGKRLNQILVLVMFPIWSAVLVFLSMPSYRFQQTACDEIFKYHLVGRFFLGPLRFLLYQRQKPLDICLVVLPLILLIFSWICAMYMQRKRIWKDDRVFPVRRMWRKVVSRYPFIQFCTVIAVPFFLWILTLEQGASFTQEYFSPTYGQLLALSVAVPPALQVAALLPRLRVWFINLTWLRFITSHIRTIDEDRGKRFSSSSFSSVDSQSTLYDTLPIHAVHKLSNQENVYNELDIVHHEVDMYAQSPVLIVRSSMDGKEFS